jgi:hypothetical protein
MIHDPSPQRVSACPVHFIWDGRGQGRVWVRVGFLGFMGAGLLATSATWLRQELLADLSWLVLAGAGLSWGAGQLFSLRAASRATHQVR